MSVLVVVILHAHVMVSADMMKILTPTEGTTLYVGSSVNLTISITSDAPACATSWQVWITGINSTGQINSVRLAIVERDDYPNSPLQQNILTSLIPALYSTLDNITLYLQCAYAQSYPATSYHVHEAITPYAELIVPTQGYWIGASSVLRWLTYGPPTTWAIWGRGMPGPFKHVCTTTDTSCTFEIRMGDGTYWQIQIRDAELGVVIQTVDLPTPRITQFHLKAPQPAVMHPLSNFTITWSTEGPISYLTLLQYTVNGAYSNRVDPTGNAIPNTGSYVWSVPAGIQMGDEVTILGCTEMGIQQCDKYTVTVIKKPTNKDTNSDSDIAGGSA